MNFNFVDASDSTKYKATIQVTGRLSFNIDAAKYMKLAEIRYFKVAFDYDSNDDLKIFLVESPETSITAKLYRSGPYYYIRLDKPLRKANVNFKGYSFTFTVEKWDDKQKTGVGADSLMDVFELTLHKVTERDFGEEHDVEDDEEDEDESKINSGSDSELPDWPYDPEDLPF